MSYVTCQLACTDSFHQNVGNPSEECVNSLKRYFQLRININSDKNVLYVQCTMAIKSSANRSTIVMAFTKFFLKKCNICGQTLM